MSYSDQEILFYGDWSETILAWKQMKGADVDAGYKMK